ncbi:MAG: hypothetical protein PHX02_04165 [Oscillospiraceae bacterium]|jgi:hypothetical protein|nr:hypothetical protein [Oscillospiraceae bacterium]
MKTTEQEEREQAMRRKLYGNYIESTCEYCLYGRKSSDGKAILCPKKGVMPLYHYCRKYVYDPLKRVPARQPKIKMFDENEFKITMD